jgi:hypothetical protein
MNSNLDDILLLQYKQTYLNTKTAAKEFNPPILSEQKRIAHNRFLFKKGIFKIWKQQQIQNIFDTNIQYLDVGNG